MDRTEAIDRETWPLRSALLAGLGLLCGLIVHLLVDDGRPSAWTDQPLRLGAAAAVAAGGVVFALSLERRRCDWPAIFAALVGVVLGFVVYWNGGASDSSASGNWQILAALFSIAVAVPLFQSMRDAAWQRIDYQSLHAHSWTNILLWGAACAFVLLAWLLANLLAELFRLIGIDVLHDLLRHEWFVAMLIGGCLGGAIGLLRDRERVLETLQRLATTILSVLAPVLALGLVLFVASLPFTGLEPLWNETKQTTPILLACILGAFVLVNATVGNAPDEEPRNAVQRHAALALAVVMLPLGIVAAVSIGKRIGQYGLTPDRLWAAVLVAVAIACALLYIAAIVRRRMRWPDDVRRANIALALGVCALALLLALPIVNFGAISTRSQLARLNAGKVAPEEFDWAALRFDFGPSGRAALNRLRSSATPSVRSFAARALASDNRWTLSEQATTTRRAKQLETRIRVLPEAATLPPALRDALARGPCAADECSVIWQPGSQEALAIGFGCRDCLAAATRFRLDGKGEWQAEPLQVTAVQGGQGPGFQAKAAAQRNAVRDGKVEVRQVTNSQVFVDGEPIAAPF